MNPKPVYRQGVCPKCGGTNLDYGVGGVVSDQYYYEWDCECGAAGKEWYKMIFEEHELYDNKE
jgi:hypothetical protein